MRTPAGMREEVFYKRVTWKKAGASFGVRFRNDVLQQPGGGKGPFGDPQ